MNLCLGAPGYFPVVLLFCVSCTFVFRACVQVTCLSHSLVVLEPQTATSSLSSLELVSPEFQHLTVFQDATVRAPLSRCHNDLVLPTNLLPGPCHLPFLLLWYLLSQLSALLSWVPLIFSASFISRAQHPLALPFTHLELMPQCCPIPKQ